MHYGHGTGGLIDCFCLFVHNVTVMVDWSIENCCVSNNRYYIYIRFDLICQSGEEAGAITAAVSVLVAVNG